jgi:hypothetical protein
MRTRLAVVGLCGLLFMPLLGMAERRPFQDQTSGLGLLVWDALAGATDRQRREFLPAAPDGSASVHTAGH